MTPPEEQPPHEKLQDEIVRLRTRVAELEAVALLDRAPRQSAADDMTGDGQPEAVAARRQRYEQLLQATALGVTSATGAAFFRLLVRHLAESLECDCAAIAVLAPGLPARARTLAFFADGEWLSNFEYELAGTPCEHVARQSLCAYPRGVQQQFPDDQWLVDWRIESYVGTPLADSRGRVLGLMSMLGRRPIADVHAVRSTLQIYAARAAAEIERQETEQSLRTSQAALAESEERFRQMAETIRDVYWLFDLRQMRMLYVSPAYEAIWGRPASWLLENYEHWLDPVHEDDRCRAQFMPLLLRPGQLYDDVYRIRRSDGVIRWVHDRRYGVVDAAGECYRLAGVAEDITERRLARERQEQQLAQLTHLSRLSTVGELVASISHEVNQPLYTIANYSAAIAASCDSKRAVPDEQFWHWNDEIGKAALRAGEVIRRVRSYITRSPPARHPIDMRQAIKDSVALLAAEARRERVPVTLELDELELEPVADAIAIQQVLVNLLRNAIEALAAMPADRRFVRIRLRQTPGGVEVAVIDSGAGIAAVDASQLFLPFHSTKPDGMGLGLAISRTIVEAHGGQIEAAQNPEGGSTFRFTLPVQPA